MALSPVASSSVQTFAPAPYDSLVSKNEVNQKESSKKRFLYRGELFENEFNRLLRLNWDSHTKDKIVHLMKGFFRHNKLSPEQKSDALSWVFNQLHQNLSEEQAEAVYQGFMTSKRHIAQQQPIVSGKTQFNSFGLSSYRCLTLCYGTQGLGIGEYAHPRDGKTLYFFPFTLGPLGLNVNSTAGSGLFGIYNTRRRDYWSQYSLFCNGNRFDIFSHYLNNSGIQTEHTRIANDVYDLTRYFISYQQPYTSFPRNLWRPAGRTRNQLVYVPRNGTGAFLIQSDISGVFLNANGPQLSNSTTDLEIISLSDGSYKVVVDNQNITSYDPDGNLVSTKEMSRTPIPGLRCPNSNIPAGVKQIICITAGDNSMSPALHVLDIETDAIVDSIPLGIEGSSISDPDYPKFIPSNPNLFIYARESNDASGNRRIKWGCIDASTSVWIGSGEQTMEGYNGTSSNIPPQPSIVCTPDNTLMIAYIDESQIPVYHLINIPGLPTYTPQVTPSPKGVAPPLVYSPSSPSIDSPSVITNVPSPTPVPSEAVAVGIHVLNITDTFVPVTSEVISFSNSVVVLKIVDANGFAIVLTATCEPLPDGAAFTPLNITNGDISIARGNGTTDKPPVIEACSEEGVCVLTNATTRVDDLFRGDKPVQWIIVGPAIAGGIVVVAIVAGVFYAFVYRKDKDKQARKENPQNNKILSDLKKQREADLEKGRGDIAALDLNQPNPKRKKSGKKNRNSIELHNFNDQV